MARFRDIKTLQKFAYAHASIYNHFNQDRHLNRCDLFKIKRSGRMASNCGLSSPASGLFETGSIYSDNAKLLNCHFLIGLKRV